MNVSREQESIAALNDGTDVTATHVGRYSAPEYDPHYK